MNHFSFSSTYSLYRCLPLHNLVYANTKSTYTYWIRTGYFPIVFLTMFSSSALRYTLLSGYYIELPRFLSSLFTLLHIFFPFSKKNQNNMVHMAKTNRSNRLLPVKTVIFRYIISETNFGINPSFQSHINLVAIFKGNQENRILPDVDGI